jgi:hypothetical protein
MGLRVTNEMRHRLCFIPHGNVYPKEPATFGTGM